MITIYPSDATDFGTNGLGILTPYECIVKEIEGGMYELHMEHPIDDTLRWAQITNGCILKAPVPMRESPMYEIEAFEGETGETVTKTWQVYRVHTSTGQRLNLRKAASLNAKILGSYKPGTKVTRLKTSGNWMKVTVQKGGATGWMWAANLERVTPDITVVVTKAKPVTREAVSVQPSREQLFRINNVEQDTENSIVRVDAMHVFYDLRGNILDGTYEPKNVAGKTAVEYMAAHLLNPVAPFEFFAPNLTGKVTGDYSYKNVVEILCDPDEGIAPLSKGLLVRDNFDVYVLPDQTRDMGVTVRRGKNLIGVTVTTDAADLVTRIIPVGKDKKGNDLFLDGTKYVDSSHINDYPTVYAQRIDYDVRLVDKKPDNEETFTNVTAARNKLRELAQKEYDENGVDLPSYGMEVNFEQLATAEGYEDYADLQSIHLHDTVTVIDSLIGLTAKLRVTGYEWDCLAGRYASMTLGDIENVTQTVYSYNLPTGGISGTKIANNSLGGAAIRSLSIDYAKISNAAITNLMADSLTAVNANIQNLMAGRINTDELYASMAQIASAEIADADIDHASVNALAVQVAEIAQAMINGADISEANIDEANVQTLSAALATIMQLTAQNATIEAANIDWAHIGSLTAQAESIAESNIGTANISAATIDWAQIASMSAALANISQARIDQAEIDQADIDTLNAGVADVLTITAQHGDFEFATVQRMVAASMILEQGVGDTVYIKNLAATSAMFVQAAMQTLILKSAHVDGEPDKYYQVTVGSDGTMHTEEVTLTQEEIEAGQTIDGGRQILGTLVDVETLNGKTILADEAEIQDIFAQAIDTDKLSAEYAFLAAATIPQLQTNAIEALGRSLTISADNVVINVGDEQQNLAAYAESIENMSVGGVNLIQPTADITDTEVITITADSGGVASNSYVDIVSGLEPGTIYTLSITSLTNESSTPSAGATMELVDIDSSTSTPTETVLETVLLAYGRAFQKRTFTAPGIGHAITLRVYAGQKDGTTIPAGVVVKMYRAKVETGTFATYWTRAPEETASRLTALESRLDISEGHLGFVTKHVSGTNAYDSTDQDSDSIDKLQANVYDYFEFDSTGNNPTLRIGKSGAPAKMELTNGDLTFVSMGNGTVAAGAPLAKFDTDRLRVRHVQADSDVDGNGTADNGAAMLSVGVERLNGAKFGYLDIQQNDTGVAWVWREGV